MSNIDLKQLILASDKISVARAEKHLALADLRWQRETGGLTLPEGTHIRTTRESQAQISSVMQSITAGLITDPVDWKLTSGWVGISTEQLTEIARRVADHVKRCFAAERYVSEQMEMTPGDLSDFDISAAFDAAYGQVSK